MSTETVKRVLRDAGVEIRRPQRPQREAPPPKPPKPKADKSIIQQWGRMSPSEIERGLEQPMVSHCRYGWRREGPAREVLAAFKQHRCRAVA